MRAIATLALAFAALGAGGLAQTPLPGADKRIPHQPGLRVYLLVDMEGMGSAVKAQEVIAGNEGPAYRDRTGPDYWTHYREMLTEEANAVIRGARAAGAQSFVVNEGHGGNRFANLLPWALDQEAILIRGYPRPMVMSTGIDSTFGTMMMIAMHASWGRPGVMAHNYAFAEFLVNGLALNEVGINALVAGERGVSVSLVSGDDELAKDVATLLGDRVVTVVVKTALGGSAAITYSPTRVRELLEAGAGKRFGGSWPASSSRSRSPSRIGWNSACGLPIPTPSCAAWTPWRPSGGWRRRASAPTAGRRATPGRSPTSSTRSSWWCCPERDRVPLARLEYLNAAGTAPRRGRPASPRSGRGPGRAWRARVASPVR